MTSKVVRLPNFADCWGTSPGCDFENNWIVCSPLETSQAAVDGAGAIATAQEQIRDAEKKRGKKWSCFDSGTLYSILILSGQHNKDSARKRCLRG